MATAVETPTLGEYLKGLRIAAGISQSELVRRVPSLDVSRVSAIENDRGSIPSMPTIKRWADACGAELPWRLVVRGPKGRYLSFPPEPVPL